MIRQAVVGLCAFWRLKPLNWSINYTHLDDVFVFEHSQLAAQANTSQPSGTYKYIMASPTEN
jgi:hypothetical protein